MENIEFKDFGKIFFWIKQALKGCHDDLIKLEKENEKNSN